VHHIFLPCVSLFHNAMTAAQSCSGQTPQEPSAPDNLTMHKEQVVVVGLAAPEPAAPQETAAPTDSAAPKKPGRPAARGRQSTSEKLAARAPKPRILPPKQDKLAGNDSVETVDEPPKTQRKRKAAETVVPPKSFKRLAPASWPQDQGPEGSDSDGLGSTWTPPLSIAFECDRCLDRGFECETHPTNACKRCHEQKVGCSLVPQNATTGKANRQKLSAKLVFDYRLERHLERHNGKSKSHSVSRKGKGKKLVHSKQEALQPEASGSGPSPSTALADFTKLGLEGTSSKGNSPVPELASTSASTSTPFSVEVPSVRRAPLHSRGHRQLSPKALPQSSGDDESLKAMVAALKAEIEELKESRKKDELWKEEFERQYKSQK